MLKINYETDLPSYLATVPSNHKTKINTPVFSKNETSATLKNYLLTVHSLKDPTKMRETAKKCTVEKVL